MARRTRRTHSPAFKAPAFKAPAFKAPAFKAKMALAARCIPMIHSRAVECCVAFREGTSLSGSHKAALMDGTLQKACE
jgi:hypothetical protein